MLEIRFNMCKNHWSIIYCNLCGLKLLITLTKVSQSKTYGKTPDFVHNCSMLPYQVWNQSVQKFMVYSQNYFSANQKFDLDLWPLTFTLILRLIWFTHLSNVKSIHTIVYDLQPNLNFQQIMYLTLTFDPMTFTLYQRKTLISVKPYTKFGFN